MARVRRMRTQEQAYWRDEYNVSDQDLDYLTGLILENGRPRAIEELTSSLITYHVGLEKDRAAQQITDAEIYRPADHYDVGQALVFTALDFAQGTVVGMREGQNPAYESFNVIRVDVEGLGEREFAADFDQPHPLNRPAEELVGGSEDDLSEADIIEEYGEYVNEKLLAKLMEQDEWVRFDGTWFLQALLPEVHLGHLNLAEAMIYEAGHPLPADEMLDVLDLDQAGSREAQLFALNHALGNEERFDNVGMQDRQVWYLRALEPAAVFERPVVHQMPFVPTGDEYIGLTMLDLAEELGDELDSLEGARVREGLPLSFQVNFPHLHAGTMPASRELLNLFDYSPGRHFPVTLVDGRTQRTYDGWVIPDEKFIAGLDDWYQAIGMVVGGMVSVTMADEPMTLQLDVTVPRSASSSWIRTATVDDGALAIQMQPKAVGVRHDPDTLIEASDRESVARLMWQSQQTSRGLSSLVRTVFAELAKLSPQGVAHCKAIYSGLNMYRRSGAVPVFDILTRHACFDPVGHGEWAYDGSLEGQVYETPEEMRERPLSHRNDLFRDQAVRYVSD